MREIKFRAWHPEEKKMWFDVGTDGEGTTILDTRHMGLQNLKGVSFLLQYTGLKDKNGTEIYEGDIVRWSLDNEEPEIHTYHIVFANNGWTLHSKANHFVWHALDYPQNYRVIGNIYESPHLLEK